MKKLLQQLLLCQIFQLLLLDHLKEKILKKKIIYLILEKLKKILDRPKEYSGYKLSTYNPMTCKL